ncbi:MAG TPA: hypothetical protein DEP07_02515 [Brevibacillus sp.]|nr:hypothetical protein [Brevibacillus sp.]
MMLVLSGKVGGKTPWIQHKVLNQKKEDKWNKMGLNTRNGNGAHRKIVIIEGLLTKYGERV